MAEYVRITIKLREDIYQTLKKEAGAKNISEKINEIFGLAGAFILASARNRKIKVVTGDTHFEDFDDSVML